MRRFTRAILLASCVWMLSAGEILSQEEAADAPEERSVDRTCFRVRDTRGFSAIDDRFVYVKSVRDRHYLLTMDNRCYGLEFSIKIAIANEFDRVCSNDRAILTYRDFNRPSSRLRDRPSSLPSSHRGRR